MQCSGRPGPHERGAGGGGGHPLHVCGGRSKNQPGPNLYGCPCRISSRGPKWWAATIREYHRGGMNPPTTTNQQAMCPPASMSAQHRRAMVTPKPITAADGQGIDSISPPTMSQHAYAVQFWGVRYWQVVEVTIAALAQVCPSQCNSSRACGGGPRVKRWPRLYPRRRATTAHVHVTAASEPQHPRSSCEQGQHSRWRSAAACIGMASHSQDTSAVQPASCQWNSHLGRLTTECLRR